MSPQYVAVLVVVVLIYVGYSLFRASKGASSSTAASFTATLQPGLDALRGGFQQTRQPNETDPTCVIAYHYKGRNAEIVVVGVTNQRILIVKGAGQMHQYPYDEEGEHLGVDAKTAQDRGFFDWKHNDDLPGGLSAYCPIVKNHPPFAGEEWQMHPQVMGFPEQEANLREFASLFYFQWFY